MQIKVYTLPFNAALGGFDDEPLRVFLVDKEVLGIDSQFFVKDGVPHWTVLVQYNLTEEAAGGARAKNGEGREAKEDWRKALGKEDWGLFNRLREWRAERAKEEAVPAYLVFTNKQLTAAVLERPDSLSALGRIQGVGPSRVEKYGKELLKLLDLAGRGDAREEGQSESSGTPGADGVDGVSRVVAADDGEVSEESAVHADEPDRQSRAGPDREADRGAIHEEPEAPDSGGQPDPG